jgi:hypothetical protein
MLSLIRFVACVIFVIFLPLMSHQTIARVLKLQAVSMRTMRKQQWLIL